MKKIIVFAAALSLVVLVGCSEKEVVQTVDYYKAHDAERAAMLEGCRNNKGAKAAISDNCINATKSKTELETSASRNTYTEMEVLKPSDLLDLNK